MHDLCSLFHTNDLCCGNYTWKLIGFLKWTITGLFFLYFRLFYIVDTNQIKVCRCLDLNRGSLVLEATALPTKPQPLLIVNLLFTRVTLWSVLWHSNMFYLWSVQCRLYAFLLLSNYFCVIIFCIWRVVCDEFIEINYDIGKKYCKEYISYFELGINAWFTRTRTKFCI